MIDVPEDDRTDAQTERLAELMADFGISDPAEIEKHRQAIQDAQKARGDAERKETFTARVAELENELADIIRQTQALDERKRRLSKDIEQTRANID